MAGAEYEGTDAAPAVPEVEGIEIIDVRESSGDGGGGGGGADGGGRADGGRPMATIAVDVLAEVLVGAALQTSRALERGDDVDLQADLASWRALADADPARAAHLLGEIRDLGADMLADRLAPLLEDAARRRPKA